MAVLLKDKKVFIKRHHEKMMRLKPHVFDWNYKKDILAQEILSLARSELDYSKKTNDRDVLLSLYKLSRSAGCLD